MKKILILILFLLPVLSFAKEGHDQGNGGDALRIGDQLYMLDLVEAGVEKSPFFSKSIAMDKKYLQRMEKAFDSTSIPVALVAQKLSEVATFDKLFALSVIRSIELYSWRLVSSALVDIKDEDSSLDYRKEDLVQMAIRRDGTVRINREAWHLMNDENKAALVIHEAVYALIKPNQDKIQSSPRAREVTGYLFTSDLERLGTSGLIRILKQDFPSLNLAAGLMGLQPGGINYVVENTQGLWFAPALYPNVDGAYGSAVAPTFYSSDSYFLGAAKTYCNNSYKNYYEYTRRVKGELKPITISLISSVVEFNLGNPWDSKTSGYTYWNFKYLNGMIEKNSVNVSSLISCEVELGKEMIKAKKISDQIFMSN